ncbi:MAG: DNA polymerase I [bacterium]|nr:DNA polymerase I [bacterium]
MQPRILFLIDGMSCAYRAFFAIPGLRSASGEPTGAVYGFAMMIEKILRERRPSAIAIALDTPAPTFRHERFGAYKAHRPAMPDDLARQLPLIREMAAAYRIALLQRDGVEADDLMASMAARAAAEGYDVRCVTTDKDMLQLVDDRILMLRPDGTAEYGREAVLARYGVPPERMPDLLALAGDASDNIPGVPGIGEKTAAALVGRFGGLEGVLENVDGIDGVKRRERLRAFADQARLSRELVTLRRDVPLDIGLSDCAVRPPDRERLSRLFRLLDFRRLHQAVAGEVQAAGQSYRCAGDPAEADRLAALLAREGTVAVRLEAAGGAPIEAALTAAAFSARPGEAFAVSAETAGGPEALVARLRPLFEDGRTLKVVHDVKRDILLLRKYGLAVVAGAFDVMLAGYLLNPSSGAYGLDDLALDYLDVRLPREGGGRRRRKGEADLPAAPSEPFLERADVTFRLHGLMGPRLDETGMRELFRDVEMPLAAVLADMEAVGVRVDPDPLRRISAELEGALAALEAEIHEAAGGSFNINSPAQLGRVLFDRMGLPPSRRGKRGYSTDGETLAALAEVHPLPGRLLEYRRLGKLKSTWADTLPRMINPRTGRIHTSFNQTGTVTGRISSSDPNLQNIPVRTEIGRRIRRAFVPGDDGMVLLAADYSQIDLRILAALSGDRELTEAFSRNEDIHRRTAAAVFGVEPSLVGPELRRKGKTLNFGIVYGMSAYGLARDLRIGQEEAQRIIDRYFEHYAGVQAYIERSLAEAAGRGYVTTILNRRRPVPELASTSAPAREAGRRIAVNTPIQGSSSDVIKIAMRNIWREMRGRRWRAAMLIQIHDELLFEVDRGQADEFGEFVRRTMEGAWASGIPLVANVTAGENWGDL